MRLWIFVCGDKTDKTVLRKQNKIIQINQPMELVKTSIKCQSIQELFKLWGSDYAAKN